MDVTFARIGERRYAVSVAREAGPPIELRQAPGWDDEVPHDVAHMLVEIEFGIALGIFGQIAAGSPGIFGTETTTRKEQRLRARLEREHRDEGLRSERLVHLSMLVWKGMPLPRALDTAGVTLAGGDADSLAQVCRRLDEFSARWRNIGVGESVTIAWPTATTGTRRTRR